MSTAFFVKLTKTERDFKWIILKTEEKNGLLAALSPIITP